MKGVSLSFEVVHHSEFGNVWTCFDSRQQFERQFSANKDVSETSSRSTFSLRFLQASKHVACTTVFCCCFFCGGHEQKWQCLDLFWSVPDIRASNWHKTWRMKINKYYTKTVIHIIGQRLAWPKGQNLVRPRLCLANKCSGNEFVKADQYFRAKDVRTRSRHYWGKSLHC